jgi:hypothetical protein
MISKRPCPICKEIIWIAGKTKKGESIASCGHVFKFKKSRSEKDFDKKYVQTPYGYELIKGK